MNPLSYFQRFKARRDARAALRRLSPEDRRRARRLALRVSREATSEPHAEALAAQYLGEQDAQDPNTKFDLATILLIVQVIVVIYRLLKAIGVLKTATDATLTRELGPS